MAEISEELSSALAADRGILETFGMRVVLAQAGRCHLACTVPQALVNAGGFAHGSIAFSMMDTACAYALRSAGVRGVTSNANVSYVKGAQGGSELLAEVAVVSQSRRVATLRGETYLLEGSNRRLAAHGSFVFQLQVKA